MAYYVTTTDLWYDADGMVCEESEFPFFYVSPAETQNVTIDGIRASGIDAGKVVYLVGNYAAGHGYAPCVRQTTDSAIATARKVIGVSAAPAQINNKIPVYTSGVVKVTALDGGGKNTIGIGKRVFGTYGGCVSSCPTWTGVGTKSYIDAVLGRAIQSAGAGDEFLCLIGRGL